MNSWFYAIMVAFVYFLCICIVFAISYSLRVLMDKVEEKVRMEQGHKDSVEILSMVESNEDGCDIGEMFNELEKNNINTDFKYKI